MGLAKEISYDFGKAAAMFRNFEVEVDRINPGAYEAARKAFEKGKTNQKFETVMARLTHDIPHIMSKRVDYSMSRRVLHAMLADVTDAVVAEGKQRHSKRLELARYRLKENHRQIHAALYVQSVRRAQLHRRNVQFSLKRQVTERMQAVSTVS